MSLPSDILSRNECAALKGIGILMIALHNLCHWMPFVRFDGNEYYFEEKGANFLLNYLQNPDENLLLMWLAMLGYCGIHIFLFVSAYGLVKKYEQSASMPVSAPAFIGRHYAKLWRLMIGGLLLAVASLYIMEPNTTKPLLSHLWQVLMIGNLIAEPYSHVWPGPYWFLGLMVQLYIIYRLVLYVPKNGADWRGWLLPLVFALVCVVPQFFVRHHGVEIIRMRYNFPVAGLSFAAGLLLARYGALPRLSRAAWAVVAVLAAGLYHAMQFDFLLWQLSPLVLLVALLAAVKALGATGKPMRALVWCGGISSALFIMHPVVRIYFINWINYFEISASWALHLMLAAYLVVSLLAAVAYQKLLATNFTVGHRVGR